VRLGPDKDLKLICVHDNYLNGTTNIRDVFPDRHATEFWAGKLRTDYFTKDFTLDELKKVSIRQYYYRDQTFNEKYHIQTLEEYLDVCTEFNVGAYIETKNSTDFNTWLASNNQKVTYEEILKNTILGHKFFDTKLPLYFQSFEMDSVVRLKKMNFYPSALYTFLIRSTDEAELTQFMVDFKAHELDGLGFAKHHILKTNAVTRRIETRHVERLREFIRVSGATEVHVYTFKNENENVPFDFEQDYFQELEYWLRSIPEVTGYFCDFPKSARRVHDYVFSDS